MPSNPLGELKRRLEDDSIPLPKRLCLAKNIVVSHHFPSAPKERIVSEWMNSLSETNRIGSEELHSLLDWFGNVDDLTGELKIRLIHVVSNYVQNNELENKDKYLIISFVQNDKLTNQFSHQIDEFLKISITLLRNMKINDTDFVLIRKLLSNFTRFYKESKKKLEFIVKLIQRDNLDTLFCYLDTDCRSSVIELCQNILFPINKRQFFISYLQTLIWKDNLDELISEKGDNIQSVLKIMSIFFDFNECSDEKDEKFLKDFIDVFVTCFKTNGQIVFAFYILVANVFELKNVNITPTTEIKPISFINHSEKSKRIMLLNMLETLLQNEIDTSIRLTDTFGEKVSKIEIKKNFSSLLQNVMVGQLKLEGKAEKTTIEIINTALKLDPSLIEEKIEIIPNIMSLKKPQNVIESYIEMLNCLLETLFKLSRGITFINQILPFLKINLEASNTEQEELREKIKDCYQNGGDSEKLKLKLINLNDVFPQECVDNYGRLTTDLMFRQNKELLESLQKDFEENCLIALEEGLVNPSTTTLTEVLSAILSSFLRHSKMADHTVPQNIAQEFWELCKVFEADCMKRYGKCVLKLKEDKIVKSFLQLCLSYSQLKLLNMKYSNYKLEVKDCEISSVYDLSFILPCLNSEEWNLLAQRLSENDVMILDNLILIQTMALEVHSIRNSVDTNEPIKEAKSHLIKQLHTNQQLLQTNNYFHKVLFNNLNKKQCKELAKILVKLYLNESLPELNNVAMTNNKNLLNFLVLEVAKTIMKCFENCDILTKALSKKDFNIIGFSRETDMKTLFLEISLTENSEDTLRQCLELLKKLPVAYLEENYQLTAIFALLTLKKCCQSKKIRKSIDNILQNIFELSQQSPDLYQIFSIEFIFSFKEQLMIDLLTLKIKNSNQLLVIKSLIESAVKRVRTGNKLAIEIVDLLITEQNKVNSIETFSDTAFQITCIILPLIVKQKKLITTSAHRSILADLQEKLHKILLETFKNIDFGRNGSFTGNAEGDLVENSSEVAILNAIPAYTLTLSRYCETNDVNEIRNLDCLWSGLEFFITHAIKALENENTKPQHIESSILLVSITLRHIKKLESHPIFAEKDKLFAQIWSSILERLKRLFNYEGSCKKWAFLEEIGVTLKFVCELSSVECFLEKFVTSLSELTVLQTYKQTIADKVTVLTSHTVSKYLWSQCLKANIAGPKCNAMTKTIYQHCKNLKLFIRQHYDSVAIGKKRKLDLYEENRVKIDDSICELIKIDLDILAEVIFAGKKVTLDYKFLDEIFELQQMVHYIIGFNTSYIKCEISWQSFFILYEGCVAILNSLLVSREELLEDRWPCFMQCYRALIWTLSQRATSETVFERHIEEKLAEIAHTIEKLTQSISKRKKQVSRISAYTIADICTCLERSAPSKMVRQHLENSVALLIQASDSGYAMAFLKRALAGSVGQITMTNLYTMYKRYHKYVGNA